MSYQWHCFYNQYSNIVFFQIQGEWEINQDASLACLWYFVVMCKVSIHIVSRIVFLNVRR